MQINSFYMYRVLEGWSEKRNVSNLSSFPQLLYKKHSHTSINQFSVILCQGSKTQSKVL